jgi:solute carrier family 35 protein E1
MNFLSILLLICIISLIHHSREVSAIRRFAPDLSLKAKRNSPFKQRPSISTVSSPNQFQEGNIALIALSNSSISKISTQLFNSLSKLVLQPSKYIRSIMLLTTVTQRYLKLGVYFFLAYFFTVVYNVSNKKVLDALPLPLTVSALTLLVGIPLFLPFWLFKPPVHLLQIDKLSYSIIACCHGFGHLTTTYSLFAGSVSFTHVVKSAEPIFTALLSYLVTRKQLPFTSYLTLLPIVFGVALASLKEFNFTWVGFLSAMASNFFYQLRMVLSKNVLTDSDEKRLSAVNTFRVVTILSFLLLLPFAFFSEYALIQDYLHRYVNNLTERNYVLHHLTISGISFYLYNEINFWILDLVHPVTTAVGNTIKRVVIVIASILIFRIPVNALGMTGSIIAIIGSLLYALTQESKESLHKQLESKEIVDRKNSFDV